MKRKVIFFLCFLVLLLVCVCAGADLAAPQNLRWKDGSTATATWDTVSGANYYYVKVSVYHDGTFIGEAETGTSDNSVDVQGPINTVVGTNPQYAFIQVEFTVCSAIRSSTGGDTQKSQYAAPSGRYNYKLKDLSVPSNLALSNQYLLSWNTVEGAEHYEYSIKGSKGGTDFDEHGSGFIYPDTIEINGNQSTYNMADEIMFYYANLCQQGKINKGDTISISVRLSARAWVGPANNQREIMTDFSAYSESRNYANSEAILLTVPSNLSLDNGYSLSWDTVKGAEHYEYSIKGSKGGVEFDENGSGFIYPEKITVSGNRSTYNMADEIMFYYANLCQQGKINKGDTISVSVRLSARAWIGSGANQREIMTNFSAFSDSRNYANSNILLLAVPSDLVFDNQLVLSWVTVEGAYTYEYSIRGTRNGTELNEYGSGFIPAETANKVGNKSTYNLSDEVKYYYTQQCQNGSIRQGDVISISVKLSARAWIGPTNNQREIMTNFSGYSNEVSFSGAVSVKAIRLSPDEPILFKGHTLYLGITITPENATYSSVTWTSSDPSVATVDSTGKITGVSEGKTTIKATIGDVAKGATLVVYTVDSNVSDEQVADCAGSIIDEIGNNENPDIENTDIAQGDLAEIREGIHSGMENGDDFRTDWWANEQDKDHYNPQWDEIAAKMEGGQFACGYDAGFEMYHEDGQGKKHTIGNITEFDKEIEIAFDAPDIPDVQPGYSRSFTMVRIHEGEVEAVPVDQDENGKFVSKSDCFSDFVLLYKDTPEGAAGKIRAFVNRCYTVILGRGADPEGLEAWANALSTGVRAASEIIDGFVNSPEFRNKGLSSEQQVIVLYRAMLGREPDPAGLAAWTDVLNQGYPFGTVINGFCGSPEFTNLCAEYGIQPGSVDVGDVQPVTPTANMGKIKAFVTRCYSVILGRDPDPDGLNAWADALATGVRMASEIIDGFVNSPEFLNKNLSKEEQVDILYQAMLGRGADPEGKAAWVQVLNEGNPFGVVINGFCGSIEFNNLCAEYGIQPGSVQVQAALVKRLSITPEGSDPEDSATYVAYNSEYINEEKIRAFVEHCYETVLGREGDEEGIANYTALIMDGKKTPKRVAYEFVFSPEFQNQLPGNEELIKILYKLYLNREPGAEELAGWIEMLEGGAGLDEVLKGFAESAEFRAIVKGMKE